MTGRDLLVLAAALLPILFAAGIYWNPVGALVIAGIGTMYAALLIPALGLPAGDLIIMSLFCSGALIAAIGGGAKAVGDILGRRRVVPPDRGAAEEPTRRAPR